MDKQKKEYVLNSTGLTKSELNTLLDNPYEKYMFSNKEFLYFEEDDIVVEFPKEDENMGVILENVSFPSLEEVIAIQKNDLEYTFNHALKDYIHIFDDEEEERKFKHFVISVEELKRVWESTEPMGAKRALRYNNMERRMVALRYIGAQGLINELGGYMIDRQTVRKKQKKVIYKGKDQRDKIRDRNPDNYETIDVEYEDTYTLYRIEVDKIVTRPRFLNFEQQYIYVCSMKDTSTERQYYIFVDPEYGEKEDAILAISSTLRTVGDDGKISQPLSKQEYLKLKSET